MAARLISTELLDDVLARFADKTRGLVESAAALAQRRGQELAPMQSLVLAILSERGKPLGAYDLIDEVTRQVGRPIRPPSVYRSIDALIDLRLVARIASRNAFVLCAHPDHRHDCVLMICDRCGATAELEDRRLDRILQEDAEREGFATRHRILELEGTCKACRAS
jgi:Fur family transcriptional regulator, zinc uptake regulator